MSENVELQNENMDGIKELFLFELDKELYAVSVEKVERVMKIPPITPVPNAPKAIVGIFHLQGKVVVVIDLINRMEMPKQKPLTASYLFVVQHAKDQFAILIDKPRMMVRVPVSLIHAPDQIIAAHVPPQYISGVFMHQDATSVAKRASILIEAPRENTENVLDFRNPPRPVLWLDLEKLLNQEDLAHIFTSQDQSL